MKSVKKTFWQCVPEPPKNLVEEPMENKPNLIPFDLEKAKAGAKVIHYEHPSKIIYETEKFIFLAVLPQNEEPYCVTVEKGEYEGLFIESEPLPEMVSVDIPNDVDWKRLNYFYMKSKYYSNDKLSDILRSFVKSLK